MERRDEGLTTRDLAGTAEPPPAEAPPADDRPAGDRPADVTTPEEPTAGPSAGPPPEEDIELLPAGDRDEFSGQWEEIQTGFVDEPRQTVERADALVATVMQRLADGFASERDRLEQHWDRGEDISTEDLRIALQRYRSFFRRLLSA